MKKENIIKGQLGENLAKDFLKSQNLIFVQQNFKTRLGEIDLIFKENDVLVFVEVKLRKQNSLVSALEAIDYKKQQKLQKAALEYLQKNYNNDFPECRFDGILITELSSQNYDITWLKGIF